MGPCSCRLSPTGIGFLDILFPPRNSPPSRSAYQYAASTARTLSGLPCSARNEIRPGWVPSLLRGGGVVPVTVTWVTGACRFTAASPVSPLKHPIGEGWDHEAYEDLLTFTRPVFPSPAASDGTGTGFGFSPGLHTPRLPVTHARAGTVLLTLDRVTPLAYRPPNDMTTHHVRLCTSHGLPPSARGPGGR